jgi:hypothetical protein
MDEEALVDDDHFLRELPARRPGLADLAISAPGGHYGRVTA